MIKTIITSCILFIAFVSCNKGGVKLSINADDTFWVTSDGSDMPVWVKGNTLSKVIILIVHGGPGEGAYNFSDFETATLRTKYAVAYWDQRNAGSSAGNSNFDDLSLTQMTEDLNKVVKVLKYRYSNASVFLYAHSFGGLLSASYLTTANYQDDINGWIDIDGAHNYPLCNSDSKKMLIDTGMSEISKGHNVDKWIEIVNYCKTHNPRKSFNASEQIEVYAHDAEGLMGAAPSTPSLGIFTREDPFGLLNNWYKLFYTSAGDKFINSLQSVSFSNQLSKVKTPALLLWGKYDFTVPSTIGDDAQKHLGSAYKKMVIFDHSGHRPMQGDTEATENEIIQFVELFK